MQPGGQHERPAGHGRSHVYECSPPALPCTSKVSGLPSPVTTLLLAIALALWVGYQIGYCRACLAELARDEDSVTADHGSYDGATQVRDDEWAENGRRRFVGFRNHPYNHR